jgi:plasmid stabilization system protein ParE
MVKIQVKWSVEARDDLKDILEYYIVRNKSKKYSVKLNSKIKKSIAILIKNPFLGIQTDIENVRILIKDDYQIIYEIVGQSIIIVLIWDSRRNPDDKFSDERF